MPETAVDENDFAARSKNNVRLARQSLAVKTVAVSHPMNQAANSKFY